MDFNPNKLITNTNNWELGITMEDQILLHDHQLFSDLNLWPNYPLSQTLPPTHDHPIPNSNIFQTQTSQDQPLMLQDHHYDDDDDDEDEDEQELGAMKEMMYKIAAMQPVDIDPSTIHKPKRRNVRISDDPQSVAARLRRERISEKMRVLQRLVPGGTKMDTASMLDEAICYVKFLKRQIRQLQANPNPISPLMGSVPVVPGHHLTASEWQQLGGTNIGSAASSSSELAMCFNL